MIVIGIDPGFQGGVAAVNEEGEFVFVADLLYNGTMPDVSALARLFAGAGTNLRAVFIEEPITRGRQDVRSTAKQWLGYGALLAAASLACANGVPIFTPTPAKWKAAMSLTKDKKFSIGMAQALFPAAELVPQGHRVPSDGRAEALLLATFGWRALYGNASADATLPTEAGGGERTTDSAVLGSAEHAEPADY